MDKFHIDADFLLERCSDALARIGDPEAAALIRRAFPDAPLDYRITAVGLLGRIKHPDSEAAILALLETETDEAIRVWLCAALCDLFSEQGFDRALREVRSGGDDMALTELAAPAMAMAAVFGAEPSPELRALEREQRRQLARMKRFRSEMARDARLFQMEGDAYDGLDAEDEPSPPVTQTIRNTGARLAATTPAPAAAARSTRSAAGGRG